MNPALTGIASLACGAGLVAGYRLLRTDPPALRRLGDAAEAARPRRSLVGRLRDRVGRRLGPSVLALFNDERRQQIEHRLDAAGRPDRLTVARVAEIKAADVVTALLAGLVVWLLTGTPVPLVALLLYGWLRTDLQHRRLATARQQQIETDLPDFLDVMSVSIHAGLKFRQALRRVSEEFVSPLSDEVRTTLQQMDIGASRRAAFEALRARSDSPSLSQFVSALLQAEELGAPLTDAMESISADMRKAFAQRARRRAAEAAPKVSLVATVLIAPGALILLVSGFLLGADLDLSIFTEALGG